MSLCLGVKHPLFVMLGFRQATYNDKCSTCMCALISEQHELLVGMNQHMLKQIRQSAKQNQNREEAILTELQETIWCC